MIPEDKLNFTIGGVGCGHGIKMVFQKLEITACLCAHVNAHHKLKDLGSHGSCLVSNFSLPWTLSFPFYIIRSIPQHCFLTLKIGEWFPSHETMIRNPQINAFALPLHRRLLPAELWLV